jgi:excisionase family DNA binding protein
MTELALTVPDALVAAIASRVVELMGDTLPTAVVAPEPWIGVDDAAAHLACPRSRIYALASAGRLPHHKDGSRLLFKASELDEYVLGGGARRP